MIKECDMTEEEAQQTYDAYQTRLSAHATRLVAGRKRSELTDEEILNMARETKQHALADMDRIDALGEKPCKARQRKQRDSIRRCYEETGSWGKVFATEVYDEDEYHDAFLDIVEEKTGEKIRTAEDLKRLIGHDTGDAINDWQKIIVSAGRARYDRALEECLDNGGKYADLLKIDPETFELSKDEQLKRIPGVISCWAHLMEGAFIRPDLSVVADKLEAPFSVIFKAANPGFHHLTDKWKKDAA